MRNDYVGWVGMPYAGVVKYWNRLPTPIVTAPSVNSFKLQLDSEWEELFPEVPLIPLLFYLPSYPNYAIPFYIIFIYVIPTPNSLSLIIVLRFKLFCIVVMYVYVTIRVFFCPLYH